jgi:hypothetical protein
MEISQQKKKRFYVHSTHSNRYYREYSYQKYFNSSKHISKSKRDDQMTTINISEALVTMRKAGPKNIRAVPMPGQSVNSGTYQIEINEGLGQWHCILEGLPKAMADGLISQSTSRVIME